ncbi:hypothetical protein OROMI_007811 [Orobanche minor]
MGVMDLGGFIFPGAAIDVASKKTSERVSFKGDSALESLEPKAVQSLEGSPLSREASAAIEGVFAQIGSDLLKVPVSSFAGSSSAFGVPPGSSPVPPVCAADLWRSVSPDVWARFPEAVWSDAAVIASEILKFPPPAGSGGAANSQVPPGMALLVPPKIVSPDVVLAGASKPAVKPVTPSDPSANGPTPKATSFAALVSKDKVVAERIGTTDFSDVLPTAVFTREECENVSAVYKNALIEKFSFGKPDNFAIANCLLNNDFGKCKVQFLNFKHVLISLQNEDAYTRLWLKREFNVLGFPTRMFKWDPFFDFKQELALVPIWVKIMALPLQWFDLGALQTLMGTFLKADPMTINRSRLDYARICVEVNLKNTPPKSVGISCGTIFKEFEVDYEKLPSFCHHCQHIGHSIDACYIKNPSLKPQIFTNKFLNMDNLQPNERDRSVWYTVGKGKKVYETSVSGVKNAEVGMPPPDTNVSVKNVGAFSDNDILVVNNGFATLDSLVEQELHPPPAGADGIAKEIGSQGHVRTGLDSPNSQNANKNLGSVNPKPVVNVFSAIPPHNSPPPFVLGDCNLSAAGDVPVLFNLRSSGGDEKGSSDPETHRGSHQDSLKNPNELVLSSSEDDTEQTDDKAHQDGAMSDPSFNASSNFSGAGGPAGFWAVPAYA